MFFLPVCFILFFFIPFHLSVSSPAPLPSSQSTSEGGEGGGTRRLLSTDQVKTAWSGSYRFKEELLEYFVWVLDLTR